MGPLLLSPITMRYSFFSGLLFSLWTSAALASDPDPPKPCTIFSPTTGAYYDLNTITVQPPTEHKRAHKDDLPHSWKAKGYDYGTNFTINFCAPVIESLEDVVGVEESLWKNISAYYMFDGKTYSIGQESSEPVFRGRKLVLNYTSGSPCSSARTRTPRSLIGDGEDERDGNNADQGEHKDDERRKSSIISFQCERDALAPKAQVSFVGASQDECTYFFEARSMAACGGVNETAQTLGPGGVFGVIAMIAAAVYFLGGIAYQRTVMHQRGWKQLPNYSTWAGIGNFLYDILIILTSSCTRLFPRRKGYNQLPNGRNGRLARSEDENRLIDQLDEEWDD